MTRSTYAPESGRRSVACSPVLPAVGDRQRAAMKLGDAAYQRKAKPGPRGARPGHTEETFAGPADQRLGNARPAIENRKRHVPGVDVETKLQRAARARVPDRVVDEVSQRDMKQRLVPRTVGCPAGGSANATLIPPAARRG